MVCVEECRGLSDRHDLTFPIYVEIEIATTRQDLE